MFRMKVLMMLSMLGMGMCLAGVQAADDEKKTKEIADSQFARKASAAGLAEVNLSGLALRFSRNSAVRQFSQQMVDDHMRASSELTQLANRRSIALAPSMDDEHQKLYDKLKKLNGDEFDRTFMEAMVKDHEKAVKLFETESKEGKDEDMKKWAGKVTPVLKKHLEMARKICDQSKGEKRKS